MKKFIYLLLNTCIICSCGNSMRSVDNVSEALSGSSVQSVNDISEALSDNSVQSVDDVCEAFNKRMLDMERRQSVYEKKIKELETRLLNPTVRKRSVADQHVAFSTILTINEDHIGLGQTIKFYKIILNDGARYSKYSGTFTVPVAGGYMFSYFFAHTGEPGKTWLELMHNGKKVNAGVSDPAHVYQDLQGGNTAIIRAQVGDAIWMEAFHENDATLYGTVGFSSFSGVLLY
ncbi:otolin-1-A-like [Mercenaria mercenaria]|uniref:otolin-1-A-like n=1 Tax=Mercenaria mercenaria TaxID=6596 RepID=UPI00234F4159|nr:otolin-1-A-like [Mercenaria mercenaria]